MILRIIHIILAALLLVASTGFTVDSHHCGGKIVSVAILGNATDCYGNADIAPCNVDKEKPTCKKGCCHDQEDYFKADIDQQQIQFVYNLSVPKLVFTPAVFIQSITLQPQRILSVSPILRPPIVKLDIAVLFQIFRL